MRVVITPLLAILLVGISIDASVAAQRTFVSAAIGNDSASCSLVAPCRSFNIANNNTEPGGEIIVMDSGGYGPFEINNKSVAIRSPEGIYAGISVFSSSVGGLGTGVQINPGSSISRVILEGLTITGLSGHRGIVLNGNGELRLSRVVIEGMDTEGIRVNPGPSSSLVVVDSTISKNNGNGITLASSTYPLSLVLDRSRVEDNAGSGVAVSDNGVAHIRDSVFYRNLRGVDASNSTAPASIQIDNTLLAENGVGAFASMTGAPLARIRIARSTIVGSTSLAISAPGGASILSRGDNTVADNAGGETFTGTFSPK